jgi:transcriptional regulator with XRE-family HTH domain
MFKQNFIKLCIERDVAPTTVLRRIGLSNATFSCWTDESVPRQTTLQRIADYFGITVEDLLRDDEQTTPAAEPAPTSPLSQEFHDLLGQMTLQDLVELKALMEEKIKNRK